MLTCSLLNLTFLQIPLMWVSFLVSCLISKVMLGMVVSCITNPHSGQQVSCLILSLVMGWVLQQGHAVLIVVQLVCDILPYFHIKVRRFRKLSPIRSISFCIISASLSGFGLGFGPIDRVPFRVWFILVLCLWQYRQSLFLRFSLSALVLHSVLQYFCLLWCFLKGFPQYAHLISGYLILTSMYCLYDVLCCFFTNAFNIQQFFFCQFE